MPSVTAWGLGRLQNTSFCLLKLYVTLDGRPRIWVFLSKNKEEANWLYNSSRFYSAFDISGNFLSCLYDSLLVSIFTGSLQAPTPWSCPWCTHLQSWILAGIIPSFHVKMTVNREYSALRGSGPWAAQIFLFCYNKGKKVLWLNIAVRYVPHNYPI